MRKNKYIIALVFLGWILSMAVIGYNLFNNEQARNNAPGHAGTPINLNID